MRVYNVQTNAKSYFQGKIKLRVCLGLSGARLRGEVCGSLCVCDKEEKEERKAEGEGERNCCPQDPSLRFAVCLHAVSPPHSRDLRRVNNKTDLQMTPSLGILEPTLQPGRPVHGADRILPRPPGFRSCTHRRSQPLGVVQALGSPAPNGSRRLHMLSAARPVSGADALDWAPVLNHGARRCGGGGAGAGAGQHHVPAAAGEGSISSRARPALACLGAPTPRPAPPAAPLPAAQPADRGAGPAPPAGSLGASSALTPARVPAI